MTPMTISVILSLISVLTLIMCFSCVSGCLYSFTKRKVFYVQGMSLVLASRLLSGWGELRCMMLHIFFHGATAPSGPGPPHYRGFTITLRHTTLSRTPLDEWSARHEDLYLKTHITHKGHTSMPPAGFEPAIPASQQPQTHGLDSAATEIGDVTYNRDEFYLCPVFRMVWPLYARYAFVH
jgi:hypothetical protein